MDNTFIREEDINGALDRIANGSPVAIEALNLCRKKVVSSIPGSFREDATVKQKATKVASIGAIGVVFTAAGFATGGALPIGATVIGLAHVTNTALLLAERAHSNGLQPLPAAQNIEPAKKAIQQGPTISSEDSEIHFSPNTPAAPGVKSITPTSGEKVHNFSTAKITNWLYGHEKDNDFYFSEFILDGKIGKEKGVGRRKEEYASKTNTSKISPLNSKGVYTKRIAVYSGSITDIKVQEGKTAAIGDSNNGDLRTCCGAAVATAIINAAGPDLQRDLYNEFGVPGYMKVPEKALKLYPETKGRGYSLTRKPYDMKESYNIQQIEFMTVPWENNEENVLGVRRMYAQAFEHSQDLDFIILPIIGTSHPVLMDNPKLSAKIATEEFKKFVDTHKDSKLEVIFAIWDKPGATTCADIYTEAARNLEE